MSIQENQKYFIGDQEYSHEDLALLAVGVAHEKKCLRPTILDLRNLAVPLLKYLPLSVQRIIDKFML